MNFEKLLGKQVTVSETTIAIRFNLLQVCPCVSPFVFLCYLYLVFMFWAVISMFTQFGGGSHRLDFDKFCDTAPLRFDAPYICTIALWWIAIRRYLRKSFSPSKISTGSPLRDQQMLAPNSMTAKKHRPMLDRRWSLSWCSSIRTLILFQNKFCRHRQKLTREAILSSVNS